MHEFARLEKKKLDLCRAYKNGLIVCMRTTLNIQAELLKKASELTDIHGKTDLIHEGLRALIEKAAKQKLIELGGTDKSAKLKAPRKRS